MNNELSGKVIACAIEVHKNLGPGLLESTYQKCLAREFDLHGLNYVMEQVLPVNYKGEYIECGYRLDFVVERSLVLELKSVKDLLLIHEAQLMTYLKLSHIPIGLLINFNSRTIKEGIRRFVM